MVASVSGAAVPMLPAGVRRQEVLQLGQQVNVTAGTGFHDHHCGCGMRHEDIEQAVDRRLLGKECGALAGQVAHRRSTSGGHSQY